MVDGDDRLPPDIEGDGDEMDALLRYLPVPVAIVDPGLRRLTAVNAPFAEMVGIDVRTASGMDIGDLVPDERRPGAERVMADLSFGLIDCCLLRGRLRTQGGEDLRVDAWIGTFNAAPPVNRAVVVAVPSPHSQPPLETWLLRPDSAHVVLGTVGLDLRFTQVSAGAPGILGRKMQDLRDRSLADAVHPADVATLLLTIGRCAAERGAATTRLRLGRSDGWIAVRCTISPVADDGGLFYVALAILPPGDDAESADDRLWRLESHLSKIAFEVHAAGIGPSGRHAVVNEAARRGLTARQSEILQRVVVGLARGEETADMARELFVSESTLRNHLAAIYRKFGVRSKSQLLAHLAALGGPPTE